MQETFLHQLFFCFILGLSCLFSFSFFKEEKSSRKTPQGQRLLIFTIENFQTHEKKKKNTMEGLTEEADQKKPIQASQDPPQSQLEPVFLHH